MDLTFYAKNERIQFQIESYEIFLGLQMIVNEVELMTSIC